MNDEHIIDSLKKSINKAPINILEDIKKQKIVKMIAHDDITSQKKERFPIKAIMSFASIAAILLLFINFQIQYGMADSKIYIDVNPGMEITTNRQDKVIDLIPINQDANDIIKDIDFKGKDYHIVTEEIVESLVDQSYIKEEDEVVLLSVFNKDKQKSTRQVEELNNSIHEQLKKINKNPIILTQLIDKSNTIEEFAEEYNLSVGKMTFIRNLIILNPELKTEDLVKLSLAELVKIVQDYGLDIEKISNSIDVERIRKPTEPIIIDDDWDDDDDDFDEDEDDYDDFDDDDNDEDDEDDGDNDEDDDEDDDDDDDDEDNDEDDD